MGQYYESLFDLWRHEDKTVYQRVECKFAIAKVFVKK